MSRVRYKLNATESIVTSHYLGFFRIGLHREMKKAVELYWDGQIKP
ncbi:MAG: hypothetical protein ACXU9U_00860 [Parachlamydiaceae bacterium]